MDKNSSNPVAPLRRPWRRSRRIRILKRTGQLLSSWQLAAIRFTDTTAATLTGKLAIDFSGLPPAFVDMFRTGTAIQLEWLDTIATRTREFRAKIPTASAASRTRTVPREKAVKRRRPRR
jgi:hypothetical protein